MYNLNGKQMLNGKKKYSSANKSVTISGNFTKIDGSSAVSADLIIGTATLAVSEALYALNKLFITGLSDVSYYSTNWSQSAISGAYCVLYDVGYRAGGFTEETYERMPQATRYNSLCSVSMVNGIPTFTITNNKTNSITINEIDFAIACGLPYSTATYFIIAGFNLGEVTIAPNESYSFTITNI